MNGPFWVPEYSDRVHDADGKMVVQGCGDYDLEAEDQRKIAQMVCNALNAAYYARKASES